MTFFAAAGAYACGMETVYADSLVALNTAIDYLLLLSAGKLCALPLRRWRMGLGALWGGLYALLSVMYPDVFSLAAAKLAAGALAVVIAFGWSRRTPRALAAFFAVSAAFAGAIYAAASLAGRRLGPGLYIPVSLRMLLLSFALCYASVNLIFRHIGRRAERRLHDLEITLCGRTVAVRALADSGNELVEPLSGCRVAVVGAVALAPLFDDPAFLTEPDPLAALRAGGTRFRLLPCMGVAAQRALLLCFRPDAIRVDGTPRMDLMVAVSPNQLSPDGEYQAITGG